MAEEVRTGYGEGFYANGDYVGKNDAFRDLTVSVTNGFHTTDYQGAAGVSVPAGDYKIVDQQYYGNDGTGLYVVLEDSSGNRYNVPNNFFSSRDVSIKDPTGATYSHASYVDLWANSQVTGSGKGTPTGVSAALNEKDNPTAKDVGYNTYRETLYQDHSVYGDNVELGLETRTQSDVTGQKVSVDGKVYDAPYRTGEVVISPDGKQYVVETYTEQTDGGYKIVLKPTDGGESITTTTTEMNGQYKVVTSAIEKGSQFGYHADEAQVQADFLAKRESGQLTTAGTASVSAMRDGQAAGNYYARVTTADGKEVDAYIKFTGDGKEPMVIDAKTGAQITGGIKDEVQVYQLQDGDHNAVAGTFAGTNGQNAVVTSTGESVVPSTDAFSFDGVNKGTTVFIKGADGQYHAYRYEGANGTYPGQPQNDQTYQFYDENNQLQTFSLGQLKQNAANAVSSSTNQSSDVYGFNNGYNVTSIVTDQRTAYADYQPGDRRFYDENGTRGAINASGKVSTSREKSEMYDDAMWGHNLTEHAGLPEGSKYDSPEAAIATLVNTGHWTRQDATIFVNDSLAAGTISVQNSFDKRPAYYPLFQALHSEFKGDSSRYVALEKSIRSQVETLRANSERTLLMMDGWRGKASKQAASNIALAQGRILQAMNNIDQVLDPACQALVELDEKLMNLEKEDEILKKLLETQDSCKTAMEDAKNAYDKEPSTIKKEDTAEDGTTTTTSETNPNKKVLLGKYNEAKDAYDLAVKAVEDQQKLENDMVQEIFSLIEKIQSLDATMTSLGDHVNEGGKYNSYYQSADTFAQHYQEIMEDFQSTDRFPVMTNLSDYKLGDIITLDDSYGYLYKVVEVFDGDGKATGSIKIVRCDSKGNPIPGSEVLTIHDQREISPVRGPQSRKLWEPPVTVAPSTPASTPPTTPSNPTKPTKPQGDDHPHHVSDPPTSPDPTVPTKPDTTVPIITSTDPVVVPTEPTHEVTDSTLPVVSDVPLPDPVVIDPSRIGDPDMPYAPGTNYIGGNSPIEYMPYTGIDEAVDSAFGGNPEVKRAGVGALGALAGVMAGAAGIGLTALADEKKKEDEEESGENQGEAN